MASRKKSSLSSSSKPSVADLQRQLSAANALAKSYRKELEYGATRYAALHNQKNEFYTNNITSLQDQVTTLRIENQRVSEWGNGTLNRLADATIQLKNLRRAIACYAEGTKAMVGED